MTQQDKTWTLKRICLPEDENRLTDTKVDVGDLVKLIFMQLPTSMGFDGESMWVIVDHIDCDSKVYKGRVDNYPVVTAGLHIDDTVTFGPGHILDVDRGKRAAMH